MLGVEDDMGALLDWLMEDEGFLELTAQYYLEMPLEKLERLIAIKKERGDPVDDLKTVYDWRVESEEK